MSGKYRKFSPEFREEAARMVIETSRPIAEVGRERAVPSGCHVGGACEQFRAEWRGAGGAVLAGAATCG